MKVSVQILQRIIRDAVAEQERQLTVQRAWLRDYHRTQKPQYVDLARLCGTRARQEGRTVREATRDLHSLLIDRGKR